MLPKRNKLGRFVSRSKSKKPKTKRGRKKGTKFKIIPRCPGCGKRRSSIVKGKKQSWRIPNHNARVLKDLRPRGYKSKRCLGSGSPWSHDAVRC